LLSVRDANTGHEQLRDPEENSRCNEREYVSSLIS